MSKIKKLFTLTNMAFRVIQIKFLNKQLPLFASVDITNNCNLRCRHCYWWLNHTDNIELTPDEWRLIIRREIIKKGISAISLTGGEPLLRPDVIEAINDEMKWRNVSIVSNGTLPLINFGVGYFISIDGTERIHDSIRGAGSYRKIKKNIISHPEIKVVINMTINRLNYKSVEKVCEEFYPYAQAITFQFHTPFTYTDELWLEYGKERNETVNQLISLKLKFPDFIANTTKQLNLFKHNKWTPYCPTWLFVNIDSHGAEKQSCVISNTDEKGVKPLCDRCGIGCYTGAAAGLFLNDSEWFRMFNIAKRVRPIMNNKILENATHNLLL
ncbi:MAG: radical SAM protein [Candidatus Odinarchaeum yellowstonii]|uniref:Radical SAM protein n=1 Tax=Odinarchaeota yellowstonii (strain LCB_4) TaxID=1841599 RepID=A0AAF0D405_ODILC|nr:MAG: radical SAM protein [Candidatus Odinarchaeum yellowstonii]